MRTGSPFKLALCLALAIPFALAACGGGGGGTAPNPEAEAPAPPALITIVTAAQTLIRYNGIEMDRIPKPANLTLENFNIAAGQEPYTDFLDLKVGPTYFVPWADSLPDWDGISMVRGTGCSPSAPMGKCAAGTLTKTSTMDAGYLRYSAFFLFESEAREASSDAHPSQLQDDGSLVAAEMFSYSVGAHSGSKPTINATWKGGMIGKREMHYEPAGNLLTGDATVSVGIGGSDSDKVQVSFTNIVDSVTGAKHSGVSWNDIPLKNDGTFIYERSSAEDTVGDIYGSFYGLQHQEVGGIFEGYTNIQGSANSGWWMTGSFGAKK